MKQIFTQTDILSSKFLRVHSTKFYKSISSPDELGPTVVAMANTQGGTIFIGIDIKNYHLNFFFTLGVPLLKTILLEGSFKLPKTC